MEQQQNRLAAGLEVLRIRSVHRTSYMRPEEAEAILVDRAGLLDRIHTLEVACAALEEQNAELREHIAREVAAAVQDDDLEILAQLYMAGG